MSIKKIVGVCPHDCPDTCSFVTEVENGRAVKFYANAQHPITQGWLCGKVSPYLKHVYHPDRLTHPLKRIGAKGDGKWARISWQEALGEISFRWKSIIAKYGAEAILPYSYSGTLGMLQLNVANGRFWNKLGASLLERAICGEAAAFAVNRTLGVRRAPAYDSVLHSQSIFIWGHNPASTAPHFIPYLKQAQRNGTQVIVIDPRRTRTARMADWHIAPHPATDGALALGLAHIIVANHWHDETWLNEHTLGWPDLQERLRRFTPDFVSQVTGVSVADLQKLAQIYAQQTPSLIKIADGLQRHQNGGQTVRSICVLPALTGQYGKQGGGLAYSTSGYLLWDSEATHKWSECAPPVRAVNMNRIGAALLGEVQDPPLMSLYVFASNPASIAPNAGKVVEGLKRTDLFTVVHELFMTDTAQYADIVLPATSQLEQVDLHRAYGHTVLGYNNPAIPPLGECKSNWDTMRALASAMGFTESWLHDDGETVIAEVFEATAQNRVPELQAVSLAQLKEDGFAQIPFEPRVPFANGRFPTPSGKVELYSRTLAQMGLDPLPNWQPVVDEHAGVWQAEEALTLITGAAHHFVTSSFANQADFRKREGEPFIEIHPDDAAKRGIEHGDWVRVANSRGWCQLKAVVTEGVRQGVLASPKGRWSQYSGGRNVNWTTPDALGDYAGQSTFHTNFVWVEKIK